MFAKNRQAWKDGLLFPVRILLSSDAARKLGLTPIDDERAAMALRYCRGSLLDVGCGPNALVKQYGRGVGVDVHPWHGVDVLCDTTRLPFRNDAFDTVSMLACLNHIEAKEPVLQETRRVLKPGGHLLVTMIGPITGYVCHKVRYRYDPDQLERGMHHDEQYGLSGRRVRRLLEGQGFRMEHGTSCLFGLNRLYVARKGD
ncbi:MAG: class I SAM-dependent methyltransferase [Nitrospirae bacterium]|nr:class I SAM-dependent methyltransferase [Nitrospirota bacterium]